MKRSFEILMSLPWKGNVRELDNVIEHTMILAEGGDQITPEGSSCLHCHGRPEATRFYLQFERCLETF